MDSDEDNREVLDAPARQGTRPVNLEQKVHMVSYMEQHTYFAQGEFTKPMGMLAHQRQWEDLAEDLNTIPDGARKSVAQWVKVSLPVLPLQ